MSVSFRKKLYDIIFEHDSPAGKYFDIALILCIIASVTVVMLDSVEEINAVYGDFFYYAEWFFTALFTIEYLLRLYSIDRPLLYARSFYGIIDLLAVIPSYISLLIPGTHYLLTVRILRILRVFRVLKFVEYISEANILMYALRKGAKKIQVFLFTVLTIVVVMGSIMYVVESNQESGFTSIPISVYWAVVTLTTVGYGDISPASPIGQFIASIVMVLGYSIIAIPTGIMSVEISRARKKALSERVCHACSAEGHDEDAEYCKYCGQAI